MTDIIYKILGRNDTIGSPSTEKIIFNDSVIDAVGNTYILNVIHNKPKGITGNQSLGQDTRDQQPEGILGEFYTIKGAVPFADGTIDNSGDGTQSNATITQLKAWSDGLDTIPGQIIHGAFGIELNSVPGYKLSPISSGETQIGLLWAGLEWEFNLILNMAKFTLKLKVDRGNDA